MNEHLDLYQCTKCGKVKEGYSKPDIPGCIFANHSWAVIAAVGDIIFQCRNCRNVVYSQFMPKVWGCAAKDEHSWFQLGTEGRKVYKCNNCSTMVYADGKALDKNGCPDEEYHEWVYLNYDIQDETPA